MSDPVMYNVSTGISTIMRTHRVPIDSSTPEIWADTLIRRVKSVVDYGFGFTCTGKEYDLDNFLADTFIGGIPWDEKTRKAVAKRIVAHPDYPTVERAFQAKYGCPAFGGNLITT
jgi:hypothetical protein